MRSLFFVSLMLISVNIFSQRLYPFPQDGKWGYIDKSGTIVVKATYNSAGHFIEGMAKVAKINDRDEYLYGFIDVTGREVIPPKFVIVSDFDGGSARVKIREKYFYLLKNGTVLTRNAFDDVYAATNGMSIFKQGDKFGYADADGNIVLSARFTRAYNFSEDGFAVVSTNEGRRLEYGIITKRGTFLVEPEYTGVKHFVEGFSALKDGSKWNVIDSKGLLVSDDKFEAVGEFSNGLINVKKGGKWGFINSAGEIIIPFEYNIADKFSKGLAIVGNGKLYGYINKAGEAVAPFEFTRVTRFDGKLARVAQGKKNGFMNAEGRFNLTDKISSIGSFHFGRARMRVGNNYGYYSSDAKLAIKPTFLYASDFKEDLAMTMTPIAGGYKASYINKSGTIVKTWLVLSKPIFKNKDVFYSIIYPSVPFYKDSDPNSRVIIKANYGDSFIKSYQRIATPLNGHGLNGLLYASEYYARPGYIFSEVVSLYSPPKIGIGISSYFRENIGIVSETGSPTSFKGPMNAVFFNGATLQRSVSSSTVEDKYFIPFMKVSESLFLFAAALGSPIAEYPDRSGELPNYLSSAETVRFSGRKDSDDKPISYVLTQQRSRVNVSETKFGINVVYTYPIPVSSDRLERNEPIFIADDSNLKSIEEPIVEEIQTNNMLDQVMTDTQNQTEIIIEQVRSTNSIDLTDAIIMDAIKDSNVTTESVRSSL